MEKFNLELAKAGHPVCTRDGKPVRIVCFDAKGDYPIVGLEYNTDLEVNIDEELPRNYTNEGFYYKTETSSNDLMMVSELKESEDEKLKEQVVYAINQLHVCECTKNKLIAWLEKQGKLVDEYEDKLDRCACNYFNKGYKAGLIVEEKKSSDRVKLMQEWSEEDEKMFKSALWHIKNSCGNRGKNSGEFEVYNWFKSLKDHIQPQSQWKPGDKQMSALANACDGKILNLDYLNSLYQDLKKLKLR